MLESVTNAVGVDSKAKGTIARGKAGNVRQASLERSLEREVE